MDEEIVVTVSPSGETPPSTPNGETPAPVVIVADTPPANPADSTIVVFTLEMLAGQIAELRTENDSLKSRVDFLSEWQSGHANRIAELETVVEDEGEDDPEESETIVAEVIPDATPETPAESPPQERKRRFV